MENSILKSSVEFLLYSYFGVSYDDKDDVDFIINKVIRKAKSDALSQGAYYAIVMDDCKAKSMDAIACAESYLSVELVSLLNEHKSNFDIWHKEVCKNLVDCFNDVKDKDKSQAFSYGNAQKWLNMSVKYLFIINSLFAELGVECEYAQRYNTYLKKNESNFHIPVDSYIIDYIYKCDEVDNTIIPGYVESKHQGKTYKKPSDYLTKWSKWTDDDDNDEYTNFQEKLRKSVLKNNSPILWESKAWIKQAIERRNK